MLIDTDAMFSMTEANQNFSKVAKKVDEFGSAVILKNNTPRYLVLDFNKINDEKLQKSEKNEGLYLPHMESDSDIDNEFETAEKPEKLKANLTDEKDKPSVLTSCDL